MPLLPERFQPEDPEGEGLFDQQLSLPIPQAPAPPSPCRGVRKRDGSEVPFDRTEIADAIFEAAQAVGGADRDVAESLATAVEIYLSKRFTGDALPTVDHVHDAVERVLIQMSHSRTALAYARRRDRSERVRRLRDGDLQVLLNELEEARFEREAREARGELRLFARHGGEKEEAWDLEHIIAALQREAGLTPDEAHSVGLAVERQIIQAGVRRLTAGLVREWVSAELLTRGKRNAVERWRQLGLPLAHTENTLRGRTPESAAQHPGATDDLLARAVKREYALAQVLPQEVSEAHLRGDIHVGWLSAIDRFDTVTHALPYVARHGVWAPGGRQIAPAATHGDTLLAHMVKWDELLRHYTCGPSRWAAVNVFLAPYLYGLEEAELQQFAQMMLYEYAYRALAQPGGNTRPAMLEVCWNVPRALKQVNAIGSGGETLEEYYGALEHTAQQLAWAIVEEVRSAASQGAPLPSPLPVISLEGPALRAPGQERFIAHAGAAIAAGAPLRVEFHREQSPQPQEPWSATAASLPPVTLNLPRAAYTANAGEAIEPVLERMLSLAVQAHRARRAFVDTLAASRTAPLGMVSWSEGGGRYIPLEDVASPIAVEGLREAVIAMTGVAPAESPDALGVAQAILRHLRERCAFFSQREGFPIPLVENTRAELSHRMATVDLSAWPDAARRVVRVPAMDHPVAYTTGANVGAEAGATPWDAAAMDTQVKQSLDAAAPVRVELPEGGMGADSLATFLVRLYRDTPCEGAVFNA